MMKDHIYKQGKTKTDENTWFTKYAKIVGTGGCTICHHGGNLESNNVYTHHKLGDYQISVLSVLYHNNQNCINNKLLFTVNSGNKPTDKIADCLYGTREELENWKYFVFNNKLPLFGISLITDQNNTVKQYIPWIVNKQYTDDEIYNILNINKDEQLLINLVIKKFERNSKWFKRYMVGE